jgi:hypothetical protein
MQLKIDALKIDALKDAGAWPGAGQAPVVVLASQLMAAELKQEGHPPPDRTRGASPANGKVPRVNPTT